MTDHSMLDRRTALALGLGAALAPAIAWAQAVPAQRPYTPSETQHPLPKTAAPMKIGIIGSGIVGGNLGEVFNRAGHNVMFSDRDPAASRARSERAPGSRVGTVEEAIAFADILVLAVPPVVLPALAQEHLARLKGKILLDVTNPNPERDSKELVDMVLAQGTGTWVTSLFPGARVVRGFSSVGGRFNEAGQPGEKIGVPLASDDPEAAATIARLAKSAGYEPVIVGNAATAKKYELRTPASGAHPVSELRRLLGMPPA